MSVPNKRWKDNFDLLDCPHTEGMTYEDVSRLMLTESAERLEILEWLLLFYQPRLSDTLDPAVRVSGKVHKSKAERMLRAASLLALCESQDLNLIEGTAPTHRQTNFINNLLDLVMYKNSGQHSISLADACLYIDSVAKKGILTKSSDKLNLLPKDMNFNLKAELDSLNSSRSEQPSLDDLRTNYQQCKEEVEKLEAELSTLQRRYSVPTASQQKEVPSMNQMLSSSILHLDQLASGFLHSYESHIGTWCQGPQPLLNNLGPTAKKVHTQLKTFVSFLEDISKLRQYRCDLEDNIKEKHTRQRVEAVLADSESSFSKNSIQQCLGVLEESKHREESGFKSRYDNLLRL